MSRLIRYSFVPNLLFVLFCFTKSYSGLIDKYTNPVLLTLAWVGVAYLFFYQKLFAKESAHSTPAFNTSNYRVWLGLTLGVLSIGISYFAFGDSIRAYSEPVQYSDVIPQLEAQFNWFANGEFPYQVLHLETHSPYPVYMPMHWLPIGISYWLQIDTRWSGYIVTLLVCGLVGFWVGKVGFKSKIAYLSILLLGLPLFAFLKFGRLEIPVSYELVVAAYYLILCLGLYTQNLTLIIVGVSLCLMSRYTLVFWMPLFALLFLQKEGFKKSLVLWGSVIGIFILVYAIPFLSKDFTILTRGLKYHNDAVIADWVGYKDTGISYTMEKGVYFAAWMKSIFTGDMAARVFKARVLQAGLMLLLFFGGFLIYQRIKNRINLYDYSLVMLFIVINTFYVFGPLTYQYYLLTPLMISAFLVVVMYAGPSKPQEPV